MKKDEYRYSAGLVFLERKHVDTIELSNEIQEILETHGHRIRSIKALEGDHICICTDTMSVDLSPRLITAGSNANAISADPDGILARAKMIIGLSISVSKQTDMAETQAIKRQLKPYLAEITYQLALASRPCFVMWLRASAILETLEFIETAPLIMPSKTDVSPRDMMQARGQCSETAEQVYDTTTAGKAADKAMDTEGSLALRTASWTMVTTIGLFYLPFAIVLCIINIVRGEDLRLAAHTLALTGFAITLNASGAFAETMTMLGL
ncbi:hypothetical protein TG4357_00769 [Thalassovita gelatinovora]|uniref:Uncharacterized protein n=1 Tax=Thalassovita gelatinovora TaxID=53501 RepID=A0A0P1F6M6_THAGE|nr:hypothetical protein [Thalassovita gelatinovora]QIZ79146.1 hypothetical protein HFZ77_00990 [Thalassovita gelatinovora]CUH63587.1 hypothetical protein TG4357_00769 [Thalassovita gelatinovora]SER00157.1 hypothetical protein SAMN04488043_11310 [Thalassovita gelatinovora]